MQGVRFQDSILRSLKPAFTLSFQLKAERTCIFAAIQMLLPNWTKADALLPPVGQMSWRCVDAQVGDGPVE